MTDEKRRRIDGRMKLKQYLEESGISAAELARRAGVHRPTLMALLAGKAGATATTARALILATGGLVTLDDLTREAIVGRPPKRAMKK